MSKLSMARCPDYQFFDLTSDGLVNNAKGRCKDKLQAIPLPDLRFKRVLDVGCDFGFWSFLAANKGASKVIGLDRNRKVQGQFFDLIASNKEVARAHPYLNCCDFIEINLGQQWFDVGAFDHIFMFSMYHHVYENCGDHQAIFYWLWRQCAEGGEVLWENPLDLQDSVANAHITGMFKRDQYTRENILAAMALYFDVEYIGEAMHEPHRFVYRLKKKQHIHLDVLDARMESGAGGATPAFLYDDARRSKEFAHITGHYPVAGSLNLRTSKLFDWSKGYLRAQVLDVADRSVGLGGAWALRPLRLYPVLVNNQRGWVFRFEGENYPENFVEVVSDIRFRDIIAGEAVRLTRFL